MDEEIERRINAMSREELYELAMWHERQFKMLMNRIAFSQYPSECQDDPPTDRVLQFPLNP